MYLLYNLMNNNVRGNIYSGTFITTFITIWPYTQRSHDYKSYLNEAGQIITKREKTDNQPKAWL